MIKKTIVGTLIALSLFTTTALAHDGVVVNNFKVKDGNNNIVKEFKENEKTNILGEENSDYILKINNQNYKVPKEHILKTTHVEDYYSVKSETATLKTEANVYGQTIKSLNKGEILYKIEEKDGWAKISTIDTIEGWVYLPYLEHSYKETKISTVGYSVINKIHQENGKILALNKGDTLNINDVSGNSYKIKDGRGIMFTVPKKYISLNEDNKAKTREISNKGKSLSNLLEFAYAQIGKPYVWGATGYNSYDCSGLTQTSFKQVGVNIPRVSSDQGRYGEKISKSDLQPGDLVFFNTDGSGISHVGLYIGEGNMIHAPTTGKNVMIANINGSYYSKRYVGARRVL